MASEFLAFKPAFGRMTIAGHAMICGHDVGILSNNGPIDADGAAKAGQFIQLCCRSDTPILFLQNTTRVPGRPRGRRGAASSSTDRR